MFEEIHLRIADDYAKRGIKLSYDVAVKDNKPWTYEPHVAEQIFNDLLREAGVKVFLGRQLITVGKDGTRITTLLTDNEKFTAKQFVDATYEGDLMAAAKVSSVIGREGKKVYGRVTGGPSVYETARDGFAEG